MFNKYFRTYPWGLQMFLLMMLVFTLASFVTVLQWVWVPKIFGVEVTAIAGVHADSSRTLINAAMWSQFVAHVFAFTIPALLFAYWAHPKPWSYLGLARSGKPIHWVIVPLMMLSAIPLILFLEGIIRNHVPFPAKLNELQKVNDRLVETFLTVKNVPQYMFCLLVMAVAPAVGEELLFRGLLMRFAAKTKWGFRFAIIVSSLLFMLMHPNPIGYVPIFLAGLLLGATYYLTGSLWLAMLLHFVNNAVQVTMMAFSQKHEGLKKFIAEGVVPLPYTLLSAAATAVFLYFLWKKRTPLPDDWHDDFKTDPPATRTINQSS